MFWLCSVKGKVSNAGQAQVRQNVTKWYKTNVQWNKTALSRLKWLECNTMIIVLRSNGRSNQKIN